MSDFFDTSVLLATFCVNDPRHEASIQAIAAAGEAFCAAQSLTDLYAVLTQLPPAVMPPPEVVAMYVESLLERMQAVSLSEAELTEAMRGMGAQRATGGALYDALQLRAAEKAGAQRFFTWSVAEYEALGASPLAILAPDHA